MASGCCYVETITIEGECFYVIGRRGIYKGRFASLVDHPDPAVHITIYVSRIIDGVVGIELFCNLFGF
ncbi:hypothetical protein SDC9_206733 [bioreactor metagenome]|uniref:Uncharacterized protein n=1 Tax=bioreactor metagenome TaxID=1076179 RepID=A0A645J6D4_9ZZZZ